MRLVLESTTVRARDARSFAASRNERLRFDIPQRIGFATQLRGPAISLMTASWSDLSGPEDQMCSFRRQLQN